MQETLITYDTAVLAKEKGFDVCTSEAYILDTEDGDKIVDNEWEQIMEDNPDVFEFIGFAPTQALLQKWLREKHNIFVEVNTDCTSSPKFIFNIRQFIGNPINLSEKEWEWIFPTQNKNWGLDRTYEMSLESGLQEALKLI